MSPVSLLRHRDCSCTLEDKCETKMDNIRKLSLFPTYQVEGWCFHKRAAMRIWKVVISKIPSGGYCKAYNTTV